MSTDLRELDGDPVVAPTAVLVEDPMPIEAQPANDRTVLGLTELLLKDPIRLDSLARENHRQPFLIPRFLAIGLTSFSLFALTLAITLSAAPADSLPGPLIKDWTTHRNVAAVSLWLAFALGFTLATGVCLPSFYFYSLLAGVRVSWLQVTAQIMKGQATTAMMLMGILPVYLAATFGVIVFSAPAAVVQAALYGGLTLPFAAGLWGVRSIYKGFLGLSDTLEPNRRWRRECWLRRFTTACTLCYAAVCPVMIYTLWRFFANHLAASGL